MARQLTRFRSAISQERLGSRLAATRLWVWAGLVLVELTLSFDVPAKERVVRRFNQYSGLTVSSVRTLCQDDSGFIWIGTVGGLVRYDGQEMRPWAKDVITRPIWFLISSPAGEVLAAEEWGEYRHLYRVTPDGARPAAGPDGGPLDKVVDATFDTQGGLWVISAGSLFYMDAADNWAPVQIDTLAGERARRLKPGPERSILLITNKAIWQVGPEGIIRKIIDARASDIVFHPDGAFYIFALNDKGRGEVIELREGKATVRLSTREVGQLAIRGRVVWASYNLLLAAIRPGEPPEILGPEDGIQNAGTLFVDREGSLWVVGFRGLTQFSEPETVTFNERDGLPGPHARFLYPSEDGIWVSSWQGLGRIENVEGVWKARSEGSPHFGTIYPDSNGALWLTSTRLDEVIERREGQITTHRVTRLGRLEGCAPAGDGSLWLATTTGLFRTSLIGDSPRRVPCPLDGKGIDSFYEGHGRIWISYGEMLCHAPAEPVNAGGQVNWSCETIEGLCGISDILQVSEESLWISTSCAGVWRLGREGLAPIPASRSLPSRAILRLARSPSGGVWVLGHGTSIRVIERPDLEEGWEVVERLSIWQGLPEEGAGDILEEPDGTLWLAKSAGVVRIPPEARRAMPEPPRVELIDLLVNGRRVALDQMPQLPYGDNQLELRFAAPSYRDRSRLRYQYRLRPDAPWTDSADALPHFRFVGLRPGRYAAEVRASLDGVNWSAAPARFAFEVLTPWYLRWWVIALFALSLAGVIYAAYRIRVGFLLRLERQRTRIAMDLHDEVGSGLGSIGILSHVMADDRLDKFKRVELAKEIAQTSGELGSALTGIVWALSPGSTMLERLAYHLTEHGSRLFPANNPAFSTDFPDNWPPVHLSLAVRRSIQLIALEALHNAARHARAKRVTLGLKPLGRKWQLWVSDDGIGLANAHDSQTGMGINSMKRRAEEIGAEIAWTAANGKGTTVTVTFSSQAKDRLK